MSLFIVPRKGQWPPGVPDPTLPIPGLQAPLRGLP
jgi:hypothetical protein